jgi:hypothetical protein
VKVPTSYYETSVHFSSETRAAIETLIRKNSAKFIEMAQIAAGEYLHMAMAWDGATPANIRGCIEELQRLSKGTEMAIAALPEAGHWFIRQAQALERQPCAATVLSDLQEQLRQLAAACERAAEFKDLNRGRGNTGDDARRWLIARCAEAYKHAAGTAPSLSSTGTFARVTRLVLKDAGAKSGLSNDLLRGILQPVR